MFFVTLDGEVDYVNASGSGVRELPLEIGEPVDQVEIRVAS
jgi:hypothetical protein